MVDAQDYLKKKAAKLITKVQKTNVDSSDNLTYVVYQKAWDTSKASEGIVTPVSDEVITATATELTDRKADLQKEIDAINTLIADAV